MDARWRIDFFGGLRAAHGEALVVTRFRTQKTGALLAYLAYYQQRAHLREELIDLLWPECEPQAGRNNLSQALSSLRRQLEPSSVPAGAVLAADRATVRLNPEAVTTDVAAFQTGLQSAARAKSSPERVPLLAHAVALYRGELLCGYYEPWILGERETLAERYFQALRQLLGLLEQAGDVHGALDYARRAVSVDSLREEAHCDLMRLLAAVGEPAAALRQYRELERLLREELGATPAAATRALARDVQRLTVTRPQPTTSASPLPAPAQPVARSRQQSLAREEGENRVVTVLFTDMSRSVEATEDLLPEDAAALVDRLLRAMVDVVLKYEGRVDRFLGDGILAVFGVPHAHEDDPERAIQAAMEIREAAQQLGLEVTAGINTGEVYVGTVGSERHQEMTVIGRAVNLAARLQEGAAPGQVLVGMGTYRQTRRAFEFASLSLAAKGIAQPVAAYAVERGVPRPEKARGIEGLRAELVGRDQELARLKEALAEVLRGRGQVVSLIGEAGVGKSRLVAELKQIALSPTDDTPTPLWLEGRCLELGMTASYWLFVDLFRDYDHLAVLGGAPWRPEEAGEPRFPDGEGLPPSGRRGPDPGRARGERLATSLCGFVERGDLSEAQVEEMGPLLGNLLSLRFGSDWDERLKNAAPEQIRHQTFLAIRDFVLALSKGQPLVLVCEDLHWADSLSLDVISLFMEVLAHASLLLLCIYRPEREHKCWRLGTIASQKAAERYTELSLRELTPPQSRRLVEALLTIDDLPGSVKEMILERARGNPFFVEEVVRSLIDAGLVYREGSVWRAQEGISAVAVPESVQAVIHGRVDRLGPELKRVLECASVIGRLFRPRLLQQCLEGETSLERALWELEDRGLVYQERAVPEEEYSFKHVLTQETIYQNLLRRRRAVLHQKVAEAIETLYAGSLDEHYEALAYHYERSSADEKAVEYLLKAGEKARRAYLNEEAIGYFQRALERQEGSAPAEARTPGGRPRRPLDAPRPRSGSRRLEALKGLGQVYLGVGKVAEAEERFRQAILLGREMALAPRELVRLYYGLAASLGWQSRFDETIRIGEEGLSLLGEDTRSVEAALMNSRVALGHNNQGNWRKAQEFTLRNVPFLRRLPYSEEFSVLYAQITRYYFRSAKNVEEALEWLEALEREAEQHHDLYALWQVREISAEIASARGDLGGALLHLQHGLELSTKAGDPKGVSHLSADLGRVALSLGELEKASEYANKGLETRKIMGNKHQAAWSYQDVGLIELCRGRCREAIDALQKAAQLSQECAANRWAVARSILLVGRVYLAQGRRQDAVTQFEKAIALTGDLSAEALSGLESAHEDPLAFRGFCRRFREEHPGVSASPFAQWFLEPTEVRACSQQRIHDAFVVSLSPDWAWQDPFGDCSFKVQNGLEILAANGRNLWHINLSAPRLLQPVFGDFAAQTLCAPVSADRPAIGGLLLWNDPKNYLGLVRGARGKHEISFSGCIDNQDLNFGRGHLPAERVLLRLERIGSRVNALCSADGQSWFTVGHVDFAVADPVEVGVHAIGAIDRTIYTGAYPDGAAIRFESFEIWVSPSSR